MRRPWRQRIAGALRAGVLVSAIVAGILLVATAGDQQPGAPGPFGTHHAGLEKRRLAAGVPTMADPDAGEHMHPRLSVFVRGERVAVPSAIGIDPSRPPDLMAALHTHDSSGVIHVENAAGPTLSQFFAIWGVPFSPERLGPHRARDGARVRMWVGAEASREFGSLVLQDEQEIVVSYGASARPPAGAEG